MTEKADNKKLSDITNEMLKALSPYVSSAEYYYRCGTIYNSNCDTENAIQSFSKAIDLNPEYIHAYLSRGGCYSVKRDYGKAIEDFSRMIELKPEFGIGYLNRGITYYHQKKYLEARKDLEKCIDLEDDGVRTAKRVLRDIENKQSEKTND